MDTFPTVLGWMEARWRGPKLASLKFVEPQKSVSKGEFCTAVQRHLAGEPQDFSDLELCYRDVSSFSEKVYRVARDIPTDPLRSEHQLFGLNTAGCAESTQLALTA